ncbi:MAG TPA: FAD/NAD(P)-binding oxidoreductase, partial [Firmicutes bacterium]|nr:FAD/NAD(P)-binding oxidoreductase [Bacillota bacterium]
PRADSTHEDFFIGPSTVSQRFIHAAGMESPGLTAAPAAARLVCEHLQEAGLDLKPKKVFDPIRRVIRIRDLSASEQAQLMQQDAAYSKIV